jgi:hypothetical protein
MKLNVFIVDWVIAEVLCLKQNGCGGRVNYLLKRPLLWIPLYGSYLSTVSIQQNMCCLLCFNKEEQRISEKE